MPTDEQREHWISVNGLTASEAVWFRLGWDSCTVEQARENAGTYQAGDPAPGAKQSTLGALDPIVGTPKTPGARVGEDDA